VITIVRNPHSIRNILKIVRLRSIKPILLTDGMVTAIEISNRLSNDCTWLEASELRHAAIKADKK
jgi:hypothetical protein